MDVPETESLAFKFSVESFKLMSGGVHLSGANEFSSETNNWLGVDYARYSDQMYVVHQQMAVGGFPDRQRGHDYGQRIGLRRGAGRCGGPDQGLHQGGGGREYRGYRQLPPQAGRP